MMHKAIIGTIGMVIAMVLTGCGAAQTVASSLISPCEETILQYVRWSPDGRHIAFDAHKVMESTKLYVIQPNGTNLQRLDDGRGFTMANYEWMPGSDRLIYSIRNKLYFISLDGTTSEVELPLSMVLSSRISPDGGKIAYSDLDFKNREFTTGGIFLASLDGSSIVQLTSGYDVVEAWSPDGAQIAYVRYEDKSPSVWTVDVSGHGAHRLATGDRHVHWSPDGQWLSFMSTNQRELRIVRADGTHQELLTQDSISLSHSWNTNSKDIAFYSLPDISLKVVNIETLEVDTLSTKDVALQSAPTWSPDGSQVAFLAYADSPNRAVVDLYLADRDGIGLTRLTDNPGRYQCFNWPF